VVCSLAHEQTRQEADDADPWSHHSYEMGRNRPRRSTAMRAAPPRAAILTCSSRKPGSAPSSASDPGVERSRRRDRSAGSSRREPAPQRERPPRRFSGVFPKPCEGRVAPRQGLPEAIAGGENGPRRQWPPRCLHSIMPASPPENGEGDARVLPDDVVGHRQRLASGGSLGSVVTRRRSPSAPPTVAAR
jgi:hypothetical protein